MIPRHLWTQDFLNRQFDAQLLAGDGIVSQDARLTVDQAAKKTGKINGIASVETISRSGHKFLVNGADLKAFNQNPVVLAAHQQVSFATLMPGAIGIVEKITKSGDLLKFRGMTFDTDPLSQAWEHKIRTNIIRMVSIGAVPIDWDLAEMTEGKGKNQRVIRYIEVAKWELAEISPVAIGSNRGAFIELQPDTEQSLRIGELESRLDTLTKQLEEFSQAAITETLDKGQSDSDISDRKPIGGAVNAAIDSLAPFAKASA